MKGDVICLVHPSERWLKHPYHAGCCLMEVLSADLEGHSKLTRLPGAYLPFAHAEDRRRYSNGFVRSWPVNKAVMAESVCIGTIRPLPGLLLWRFLLGSIHRRANSRNVVPSIFN